MADPAKVQDQKEKPLSERIKEESLRNPKVEEEARKQAEEAGDKLEDEWKNDKGEKVKGKTINDRTLADRDVPGFLEWLKQYTDIDFQLTEDDFIDTFLLYRQSPEEAMAKVKKNREEWFKKLKQDMPSFWQRAKDTLKLPFEVMIGKFHSTFAYERIYGSLLDKRAQELQSANLNARDRIRLLEHALELEDKFESQAILLSLGHTSDFSEEMIEEYYRHFAKEQEGKVRHADGTISGIQRGHLGSVKDFWFEVKFRRETHIKGKRPDVWHAGRRDYLWEGNRIVGVAWKSIEWIDQETNFDGRLTPGRKGDTASETFQYQEFGGALKNPQLLAEATTHILQKKLGELEANLPKDRANFEQKEKQYQRDIEDLAKAKDQLPEGVDKSYIDRKIQQLRDELNKLKKQLLDDEQQARLIKRRILNGVDPNGIKSLLLDSGSHDFVKFQSKVTGKEETLYEFELAYNRGTYIYAHARVDRDADIVTNAEHVTAQERISQAQLMSDEYRPEAQWRAKHYSLGIHDVNGNYDETRDGAKNIFESMHATQGRGIESFSMMSRRFFSTAKPHVWRGEKVGRRVVTDYIDEKGEIHKVWLDYDLSRNPIETLNKIDLWNKEVRGIDDPTISLLQEWQRKTSQAYEQQQFYAEAVKGVEVTLSPLTDALTKEDTGTAKFLLSDRKQTPRLGEALVKARRELADYWSKAALEPLTFENVPPDRAEKFANASQNLISSFGSDYSRRITSAAEIIAALGEPVSVQEESEIDKGRIKINVKLAKAEQGFKNIDLIEQDLEQAVDDLKKLKRDDEPEQHFVERLDALGGQASGLMREMRGLDELLTDEQRQRIEVITGQPAALDMSQLAAWRLLNDFSAALGLTYKEYRPPAIKEKPVAPAEEEVAEAA